jgi:hypothetical protein
VTEAEVIESINLHAGNAIDGYEVFITYFPHKRKGAISHFIPRKQLILILNKTRPNGATGA